MQLVTKLLRTAISASNGRAPLAVSLVSGLAAASIQPSLAADPTFTGTGANADWSTASNWSNNAVPSASSFVTITNGLSAMLSGGTSSFLVFYMNGTGGSLTLGGANGAGIVSVTNAYLGVSGTVTPTQLTVTGLGSSFTSSSFNAYSGAVLAVDDRATVTTGGMALYASSTLAISGSGRWTTSSSTLSDNSALSITSGGRYTINSNGSLGAFSGTGGATALVSGTNSLWDIGGYLSVNGGSRLTISDGASVTNNGASYIGNSDAGALAQVLITGAGSSWVSGGTMSFTTGGGVSSITVADGGSLTAPTLALRANKSLFLGTGGLGGTVNANITGGTGSQLTANFTDLITFSKNSSQLTLNKLGSGTFALTGSNSFSEINLQEGTLLISNSGSSSTTSGNSLVIGSSTTSAAVQVTSGSAGSFSTTVANGSISVSGPTSTWRQTGTLTLQSGTLSVDNGGKAAFNTRITGQTGAINVSGTGSNLTSTSSLNLLGSFAVAVSQGGAMAFTSLTATDPGTSLKVTGPGSALYLTSTLNLGGGTFLVDGGGLLNNTAESVLGLNGGVVTGTLSGAGTLWNNGRGLIIGSTGTASLAIVNGATLAGPPSSPNSTVLGASAGASGAITLSGTGSIFSTNSLIVGQGGTGTLTIGDSTSVIANGARLGSEAGSYGAIIQTGGLAVIPFLTFGSGTSLYSLQGGVLDVSFNIAKGTGAYAFELAGGTLRTSGTNGPFTFSANATLRAGTDTTFDSNGLSTNWTGTLSGAGSLTKVGEGTLSMTNNTFSGNTTVKAGTLVTGTALANIGTDAGTATWRAESGGDLVSNSELRVGTGASTSSGALVITGTGSSFSAVNLAVHVGYDGRGDLSISDGGNFDTSGALIQFGYGSAAYGTATLSGDDSMMSAWGLFGGIVVGVSGTGAITVNGGQLGTSGLQMAVNTSGNGTMLQTGGTVTIFNMLRFQAGTGVYRLEGGTLNVGSIYTDAGALSSLIDLAGGTVQMNKSDQAFNTRTTLRAGTESTIDTDGYNNTWSGSISGSGALAKIGTGTLTLSTANSYTGGTTLEDGAIAIGNNSALGTGKLTLTGNSTLAAATAARTVANNITIDPSVTGTVAGTQNLTLSGTIDGSGNLTKIGTGTLALSGNNTYSGTTTTGLGALGIGHNNALGSSVLALNGGAILSSGAARSISNRVNLLATSTIAGTNHLSLTGTLTNTADANVTLAITNTGTTTIGDLNLSTGATGRTVTFNTTAGTPIISGVIADGSTGASNLAKTGAGSLTLLGSNTYSGTTTATAGNLILGNNSALGTSVLALNGGSVLGSGTARTIGNSVSLLASSTFSGTSHLTFSGATTNNVAGAVTVNITNTGTTTLGAVNLAVGTTGRTVTLNTTGGSTVIGGTIANGSTGAGGLTKTGASALTLSGSNTYSGTTTLTAGNLILANDNALGTSVLALNGGTVQSNTARTFSNAVSALATSTIGGASNLTFTGTTTNNVAGPVTVNITNTGTTMFGAVNLGVGTTGRTMTFHTTGGSTVIGGTIANGSTGAGGLTKTGASALMLSGNNTYSGTTTVTAGNLILAHNGALGTSLLALNGGSVQGDGTARSLGNSVSLLANSTIGGASDLTFTGTTTNNVAGPVTVNITNTGTTILGAVNLGAGTTGRTVTFNTTGGSAVIGGTIANGSTGAGSLVKSGTGSLTLAANNSYTGTTTINAGTVRVGDGGTTGLVSSRIVNNGALAFNRSNALAYSGTVSGTGSLTQAGTGALTLSGSNSYSGVTTIASGTLIKAHNNALGTGVVVVEGGVFFINSGITATNNTVTLAGGEYERALAGGSNLANSVNATSSFSGGNADTAARILAGTLTTTGTLQTSFANTSSALNDEIRLSDVYSLQGTGTDIFVLQLSMTSIDADSFLGWLDTNGNWVNAVLGNTGPNAIVFIDGAYDGNLVLGHYGVDTATGTVWAVLNHNSDFAIIPEPSTCALAIGTLFGALLRCRRRQRP
jgi:fibronectin-binding autotransporter adhesin